MVDFFSEAMRLPRRLSGASSVRDVLRQATELLKLPKRGLGDPGGDAPDRAAPGASARPAGAPGEVTEITSFGSNPGRLRMFVYAPARRVVPNAPLVLVLHGCGQHGVQFARDTGWTAAADRLGFPVVMAEQVAENNQGRCFNWFRPHDTRRDVGEALSLRQMVGEATMRFRSDPRRIFVVGLSAGGAMTAAMLAAYPDVFAAGSIAAGLPVGVATDVTSALGAMSTGGHAATPAEWADRARAMGPAGYGGPWPRVVVWQGDDDRTVAPVNADHVVAQWTALHGLDTFVEEHPRSGVRHRTWGRAAAVESWSLPGLGHAYPIVGVQPADRHVAPSVVDATVATLAFWKIG